GTAALRAGAEIRAEFRVDRLIVEPRRVRATSAQGQRADARACILACGVSYRLPRQLGLGLPGHMLHSAQLEVPAVDAAPSAGLHSGTAAAREGFPWLGPVMRAGHPRLKIGRMARGAADAPLGRFVRRPDVARRLTTAPGTAMRRLLPLAPLTKT